MKAVHGQETKKTYFIPPLQLPEFASLRITRSCSARYVVREILSGQGGEVGGRRGRAGGSRKRNCGAVGAVGW